MATHRSHKNRSSERDVALVQMQIAAQARNQRWHDFLCAKRDDLQTRLRQQGYSGRPGVESLDPVGDQHGPTLDRAADVVVPHEEERSPVSKRWSVAAPEAAVEPDSENTSWWGEKDAEPI